MSLLQPLDQDPGHLKAGLLGVTGSGKTYTALLLAIATRRHFNLTGPLAMYDTEGGSQYCKDWVAAMTGQPLLGVRTRSFIQLLQFVDEAEKAGVAVAVVDSIAHPWEELKESFLADLNRARQAKGWSPRALEFQDWGKIKPMWNQWTSAYLNAKLHIIVCGRAADIFEQAINEETKRKELSVVGTRMQTEKNFGYEPSLLVEMDRVQILEPHTHFVLRCTVWKDRFATINGETCDFPMLPAKDPQRREKEMASVWAFLGRHVQLIKAGGAAALDLTSKTETGADEIGDDGYAREKKQREIFYEEIQGELANAYPGQTNTEKKARMDLLNMAFGTRSTTAIEAMRSPILQEGLAKIRKALHAMADQATLKMDAERAALDTAPAAG